MNKLYLKFTFNRIVSKGLFYISIKILEKVSMVFIGFILIPVSTILHVLNFRIVNIFIERIGHLAIEPACVLTEYRHKYKLILIKSNNVANNYLLYLWSNEFIIINSKIVGWILKSMTIYKFALLDCSKYERVFNIPRLSFKIFSQENNFENLNKILENDVQYLHSYLEKLGMKKNDWYVCVHAREEGFSLVDDNVQMHRNADIDNYNKAIIYILSLGGWVIRLGDSTMKKSSLVNEKFIDYANSNHKSELLDVLLCKYAKFILGSSSGICTLGALFSTPCAISNLMPTGDAWFTKLDIYMPKKIYNIKEQRFLTLSEIMTLPVNNFRYASQYIDHEYLYFENSSEEIYNLTIEMLNFINNKFVQSSKQISVNFSIANFRNLNSNSYYSKANFCTSFFDQFFVT
ncbi:MAG: TIGR04372 family glycosyltransferase [Rickettsiaceae bacterium]|nr:TIGR04372 family glycosyltransferase [Rickettsiaceae bacterium]